MQEKFTPNHLLQSIYNELDHCDDICLKNELVKNPELAAEYRELKKAVADLNTQTLAPKESTVESIINMSKRKERELV